MGILKHRTDYIEFLGKIYVLNLERFREVCTPKASELGTREYEISQVYDTDEDGEFNLRSKVENETKGVGNPQNDMIVYDVVKMLILSLLENDKNKKEFEYDFGTAFAINTLLNWGVLEEI
jgi:hypothetical protein